MTSMEGNNRSQLHSGSYLVQSSLLLGLSDELLLLVVQNLDRHDDVPHLRLTCKKLNDISENYMFRNISITLAEDPSKDRWEHKLRSVPEGIVRIKHLTILNQSRKPGAFFWIGVPRPHSFRIMRWALLEDAANIANEEYRKSAFLAGMQFLWNRRLAKHQLTSFRWRHATALSIEILGDILSKQAKNLSTLELTMIQPPSAKAVKKFDTVIRSLPKLRALVYHGLSHTEPIAMNRPEKGGRFRMIRPIFRKIYKTLEELTLSQDHCISQVGRTPLINGRTYHAFLCDLDELWLNPSRSNNDDRASVHLDKVSKLELGGFQVAKLFDMPLAPTVSPRVRLTLSSLRRLVLNDCDGVAELLLSMRARKTEIHLTELGIQVIEDGEAFEDYEDTASALRDFLLCFEGLQVLSVLWDGTNELNWLGAVFHQHHRTLETCVVVARENFDHDDYDDPELTLRFVKVAQACVPWILHPEPGNAPKLREIGLNLFNSTKDITHQSLRLLSQYRALTTVHIRNFPVVKPGFFWRDGNGTVTGKAILEAQKFAEYTLPSCGVPQEFENSDTVLGHRLQAVADAHAADRDQKLLGGIKLKSLHSTSTPTRDLTPRVLEQRADTDIHFASIKHKVETNTATLEDASYFDDYVRQVRTALGIVPPDRAEKPKVRLLIIGEWRYRDQLNLSGPRTWDPNAWYAKKEYPSKSSSDIRTGVDDDEDSCDDLADSPHARLRPGFKKEFDVSLLPIFFKIEWEAEQSPVDNKWRWKAKATALEQSTLEGYGALADVRGLDFAWQT